MNMTTSIQLAQQCLNQGRSAGEEQAESTQMFEGLEAFAQTIESGNSYYILLVKPYCNREIYQSNP